MREEVVQVLLRNVNVNFFFLKAVCKLMMLRVYALEDIVNSIKCLVGTNALQQVAYHKCCKYDSKAANLFCKSAEGIKKLVTEI